METMAKKKVKKDAYQHSILTDDLESCYYCKRSPVQMHHIFGGHNRDKATEDDFIVPLCWECHVKLHNEHSQQMNYFLKRDAQRAYEKTHSRDEFRRRYGKSYL